MSVSWDGRKAHVYLLAEAMHMDKIGLISTNLAEKIATTVTESPYRVAAGVYLLLQPLLVTEI